MRRRRQNMLKKMMVIMMGIKGGEKGEKPSVEEQGELAPKNKKIDCECADEQCYCGKKFETVVYLNLHIQRKYKTTWMCSGSN